MFRAVLKLSDLISLLERLLVYVIIIALPLMILINTAARTMRMPIYWMDELSILAMVWMTMITMSLTIKKRQAVAVTIAVDMATGRVKWAINVVIDILILAFGVSFLVLSIKWFDPLTLINVGFDFKEFTKQTMNFMYQTNTNTLGIRKYWFWLVVPFSSFCLTVHALSNLLKRIMNMEDEFDLDSSGHIPIGGE